MKKLIPLVITTVLCMGIATSAFAAIPEGWYEVSDEELGLPSEEELRAITESERNKSKALTDDYYAAFFAPQRTDIDCKTEDLDALTDYLIENVSGFNTDLFKVELINNSVDGENYYTILYGLQLNGFETPYKVIVFVEDDNIEYSLSFDESDYNQLLATPLAITEEAFDSEIEIAKKEAAMDVPTDTTIDYQEVTKILDKDLKPMLTVKTACIDQRGGRFVLNYEYNLNEFYKVKK